MSSTAGWPLRARVKPQGSSSGQVVGTLGCIEHTKLTPGVWLQWERSNLELNVENSQHSCARSVSRGHA
jgi:hypothetical protein